MYFSMKKFLRILWILIVLVAAFFVVNTQTTWFGSTQTWAVVGLANPASVYCIQQSGTLEMVTDASGAQAGICHLSGWMDCDEWAYFRGECPSTGSVEITGNDLSGDQESIIDYYMYLQNHEFDKAAEMKTGDNSSATNLENLYKTTTKITISKITNISSGIYHIYLTYEEPCVQETYLVKKEVIDGKIKDISSTKISSIDVWATGENVVKVENDFFCFFADLNTKIIWPQSPKFEAFGSPVFAFETKHPSVKFLYETQKSWLFFDDSFGTQRMIQIPIERYEADWWKAQWAFLGRLADSLQFKITDKTEYTRMMKSTYPDFVKKN